MSIFCVLLYASREVRPQGASIPYYTFIQRPFPLQSRWRGSFLLQDTNFLILAQENGAFYLQKHLILCNVLPLIVLSVQTRVRETQRFFNISISL